MKDFYEFAGLHPFLTFLLAAMVFQLAYGLTFRAWNRWMRHLNISSAGWPPPHVDADGEFKKTEDED